MDINLQQHYNLKESWGVSSSLGAVSIWPGYSNFIVLLPLDPLSGYLLCVYRNGSHSEYSRSIYSDDNSKFASGSNSLIAYVLRLVNWVFGKYEKNWRIFIAAWIEWDYN
jgi:hypothetical protein